MTNRFQPERCLPLRTGRVCGLPKRRSTGTAQLGAVERNGKTSIRALTAAAMNESVLDQSYPPRLVGWIEPQETGTRMLSTPPRFSRCSCSALGATCGTTPQKFAGSADAAEENASAPSRAIAKEASQRRARRGGPIRSWCIRLARLGRYGGVGRAGRPARIRAHRRQRRGAA